MASIFTKIINGEIPAYKIYENEYVFSFLDIRPIQPGHTLIVPKLEVDYFTDVPEPHYSAVFSSAKIIAKALKIATGCERVGTTVLGFEVPHFHYHLVPMWDLGDLDLRKAHSLPKEEMLKIQASIIANIKN